MTSSTELTARPSWRGLLHAWSALVVIPAGILLIIVSRGAAAHTSSAIFAGALLAVFATSASYHRLAHGERARAILRRLDHSMIYLLITATYVPVCLLALPRGWGLPLLAVVGTAGTTGVVLKLAAFHRAKVLGYALYPVMGWTSALAAPVFGRYLSITELVLITAGGVAYTIGLVIFWRRRPDPWPRTFGYHEIWHLLTVVAAGLHFAAVLSLVR